MSFTTTFNRTFDSFYNRPIRWKLDILSPDENQVYYHSDGFDTSRSNIIIEKIQLTQSQWETWDCSISLNDSVYNSLDLDRFDNGAVMKIQFGKSEDAMRNAFYGIIDLMGPNRESGDKITYDVFAKGFGVVPNYTYVNFVKIPPPDALTFNAKTVNPKQVPFYAVNLVKSLWGDLDIIPLLDYTLSQRMGSNFTMDAVASSVKDFIPGINSPLVTASQVMNLLTGMSGAIWYVDENKKLNFRYPYGENSGIVIKDYYEATDPGDYTAYVVSGSYSYKDSTRPEDGFAQQLLAIAEKTQFTDDLDSKAVGFISLYNKDVAFAIMPGVSRFSNLTFIMSKTGAGTNAANPAIAEIQGYIVDDVNRNPGHKVISEFTIMVKDVPQNPSPIIKINRPNFKDIQIDKMYWIVFKERGSSEDNTIRIWHDDDFTTASTVDHPRYFAQRVLPGGGDTLNYVDTGWFVSAQGPEISTGFMTTENIPLSATNDLSISKWSPGRPVQARVSVPALKSVEATQAYLNIVVQQTSQKIRNFEPLTVTIPNNFIQSGTNIQTASDRIRDLLFENNRMAMVKSVSYSLDTSQYAIGTKTCNVTLRSYVSPLDSL
jgi:hypothetical protein